MKLFMVKCMHSFAADRNYGSFCYNKIYINFVDGYVFRHLRKCVLRQFEKYIEKDNLNTAHYIGIFPDS
jgi:hypothetical protein